MKNVIIKPCGKLTGDIKIPSSKSMGHRAVICAGLANGASNINNVTFSQDIEATCSGMKSLGVEIERGADSLKIHGSDRLNVKDSLIQCKESGSTLRFLIPLAATTGFPVTFNGAGKLVERPLKAYYDIFDEQGLQYSTSDGKLPLSINGRLKPGTFNIEGGVSSQFISGLLFSLPLLSGDSKIVITSELESKPYVDLTIDALTKFGVFIDNRGYKEFIVKGNQTYEACDYIVEGDYSQAAFWLVAGALGGDILCGGLKIDSLQGDKAVINIIERMNGHILVQEGKLKSLPAETTGAVIDASECPDLVPVLAVLASLSKGTTEIVKAGRLRIKESDRLTAISTELNKLGAEIEEKSDGLIIRGKNKLKGGIVESWNDHRIAMALAIAASRCDEDVVIKGADCVNKSYPHFWEHYKSVGGNVHEWNMGE